VESDNEGWREVHPSSVIEPRPFRSYLHDLNPEARARYEQIMRDYERLGAFNSRGRSQRLRKEREEQLRDALKGLLVELGKDDQQELKRVLGL